RVLCAHDRGWLVIRVRPPLRSGRRRCATDCGTERLMTRELQPHQRRTVVAPTAAIEDPFAAVISPARPALDAVVYLRPSVDWVLANEGNQYLILDVRRASQFADAAADRLQ